MEATTTPTETLEQMQARHRKELKDLQGRITSKKKNATKKTRKGVNNECAEMERTLREKQAEEVAALEGKDEVAGEEEGETAADSKDEELEKAIEEKLQISSTSTVPNGSANNGDGNNGGGASGAGKKRNRQKDRLARRAAEQEAAAIRAEEEASQMTDHRALESEYMKKAFQTHELSEKQIAPDGHCLFSAVADQLEQNSVPLVQDGSGGGDAEAKVPAYKTVRKAAAGYMLENADDFAPFLEEDLEGYAAKMRDTAEWGGQLELMALARRYNVEIRVIQDGRTEKIGEEEGKASGKTLWLAYYRHGYGLGEHYNSLRKAK